MLRTLTAKQFLELRAYDEIEPFGEARTDLRFAILASVVAGSLGASSRDGKPYTANTFLRSLYGDEIEEKKEPGKSKIQSVAEMEQHLKDWIDVSNKIRKEKRLS